MRGMVGDKTGEVKARKEVVCTQPNKGFKGFASCGGVEGIRTNLSCSHHLADFIN